MKHLLLSLAFCSLVPQSASAQPNIILILADDVGCEPIGAYGGESWKTPHIDALARGGMRFDYCFSMPVCHPTRLCLMTGKYPFRLNSSWGSFPESEEDQTLAAILRRTGYRTAVAGKWQLGLLKNDPNQPERMGFDEWSLFGWHEGARYHDPLIYENGQIRNDTLGKYGPELYVEFLADFIRRSRQSNRPFFAFYSMALCHDVTDDLPIQVPYVPGMQRWMNYGEMVESMDAMVGKLVSHLEHLGVRQNTLLLFTGDNGTAVRSKLRHIEGRDYEYEKVYCERAGVRLPGGKGTLLDIGTNVPLIASWPGTIEAGSQTDQLVDFSDWLPTLAELAGGDDQPNIDGVSFATTLLQPSSPNRQPSREFAYCESHRGGAWVRTQRFKLYDDGSLFDIAIDPSEQRQVEKDNETSAQQREFLSAIMTRLRRPLE